jgi:hypothetical protein
MQDVSIKPHSDDGTTEATDLACWHEVLTEATVKLGRDWECASKYKGWFQEVGFVDVCERRLQWPQNTWPSGEKNKMMGMWTMVNALDAVVSVSTVLLIRVLGMSPEEVELMMMGVRKDMKNRAIHCYYPVYVDQDVSSDNLADFRIGILFMAVSHCRELVIFLSTYFFSVSLLLSLTPTPITIN